MSPKEYHEINQGEFGTHRDGLILETVGIGPCIGVAIGFRKKAFLLHDDAQGGLSAKFEEFLEVVAREIPEQDRPSVRPVLVGTALESYLQEEASTHEESLLIRKAAVAALQRLGFGESHKFWGLTKAQKPTDSQDVLIDVANRTITVDPVKGEKHQVSYQ